MFWRRGKDNKKPPTNGAGASGVSKMPPPGMQGTELESITVHGASGGATPGFLQSTAIDPKHTGPIERVPRETQNHPLSITESQEWSLQDVPKPKPSASAVTPPTSKTEKKSSTPPSDHISTFAKLNIDPTDEYDILDTDPNASSESFNVKAKPLPNTSASKSKEKVKTKPKKKDPIEASMAMRFGVPLPEDPHYKGYVDFWQHNGSSSRFWESRGLDRETARRTTSNFSISVDSAERALYDHIVMIKGRFFGHENTWRSKHTQELMDAVRAQMIENRDRRDGEGSGSDATEGAIHVAFRNVRHRERDRKKVIADPEADYCEHAVYCRQFDPSNMDETFLAASMAGLYKKSAANTYDAAQAYENLVGWAKSCWRTFCRKGFDSRTPVPRQNQALVRALKTKIEQENYEGYFDDHMIRGACYFAMYEDDR
ncbi:hypothetical protein FUAX_03540 [Fulvitalea axinellae]|uniref:Uncharacterized protein n=1 Tax=Fulvitalea axinellae TaxID=1182444 RepID=A0AAU9CM08_9BACT|nr:hypothetical protein FUAX_03540 [Fulvitalea axinellae]